MIVFLNFISRLTMAQMFLTKSFVLAVLFFIAAVPQEGQAQFNPTNSRVFFHVQLAPANQAYYDFTTLNVPIPYTTAVTNIGTGMNLTSGIFTAPTAGVFSFTFNGLSSGKTPVHIAMYVNGKSVSDGWANTEGTQIVLSAIVNLQKGDKVTNQILYGALHATGQWFSNSIYNLLSFSGAQLA